MSRGKQIEEMAKDLQKSEHWYFNDHLVDFEFDRKKTAKNLYNAGYRKQSEWISVEERVPECERGAESKAVLFITKQGFMYTGYYGCGGILHDRYFREFKNATEGYDISNVTHWMPLPELPKMKGGGEEK